MGAGRPEASGGRGAGFSSGGARFPPESEEGQWAVCRDSFCVLDRGRGRCLRWWAGFRGPFPPDATPGNRGHRGLVRRGGVGLSFAGGAGVRRSKGGEGVSAGPGLDRGFCLFLIEASSNGAEDSAVAGHAQGERRCAWRRKEEPQDPGTDSFTSAVASCYRGRGEGLGRVLVGGGNSRGGTRRRGVKRLKDRRALSPPRRPWLSTPARPPWGGAPPRD